MRRSSICTIGEEDTLSEKLITLVSERIIMPQCACTSELYGSVSVCVCVDCYSRSRINEVQIRVSIGF